MEVIFGLKKIKKYKRPVVTLGVFDGLHLAHRYILKEVTKIARQIKGTSLVITFWPHPQREESLYSLSHRLKLIADFGIDVCIVIKFNQAFAKIKAEDFVKNILVRRINPEYICVGENFTFGYKGRGNWCLLKKLAFLYNFKLKVLKTIKIGRRRISSTYIRQLISQGKLEKAKKLLNHPVSILGTVIKGRALGKKLGFPTANINPHHEVLPPCGVYAVKVIFNQKRLNGLCYIGARPTFQKIEKTKYVEVYILNFKKNIYAQNLELNFIKKIRNEKKFSSPSLLILQIKKDINKAKKLFSHH